MKTIQRLFFYLLFFLLSSTIYSQGSDEERIAKFLAAKPTLKPNEMHNYLQSLFPEWNMKKMDHVCMMIGTRDEPEEAGSPFKYMYQQYFYEAARVDATKDNAETVAKKISAMWKIYQATGLNVCNASTFDIRDGNFLKYAVADLFDDFIRDALKWKLDLNKVDFYDQMTLLDYVDYNIKRAKGSALESKYRYYFDLFRKAGAKFKREL